MATRKKSKKRSKTEEVPPQASETAETVPQGDAEATPTVPDAPSPAEVFAELSGEVVIGDTAFTAEMDAAWAEGSDATPGAQAPDISDLPAGPEAEPVTQVEPRLDEGDAGASVAMPVDDDVTQPMNAGAEEAPSQDGDGQTVLPFVRPPESEASSDDDVTSVWGEEGGQPGLEGHRLESIIESLLFASDKALSLADLKRLLGERDGKKITAAVQDLIQKRIDSGIQIVTLSSGWHLRTHVDNAAWVSKLLVGKPVRLSRAMMETLAIVAYRQPVTRPEIDDIRGVDCGPVLKTLLDRGLVRIIGKKEEVGRPLLYGTTPEFLRVFNLRDLTELPTLREFYDLSAEDQSRVEAEHGEKPQTPSATTAKPDVALNSVSRGALSPEPEDADPLLDELDEASQAAKQALGEMDEKAEKTDETAAPEEGQASDKDGQASTESEPEQTGD